MSKTWRYTLNNYTQRDIEQFKAFVCSRHRCALEVGEKNGTPHMQGYITFTVTYNMMGLKKLNKRVSWFECSASEAFNLNYCTKGEIIIDVDNREQGKRNDLLEITKKMKEGATMTEIAWEYPTHYVRYNKGFEKLQFMLNKKKKFEKCQVTVIWGPTRTGKSTLAYEIDPDLFDAPCGQGFWMDGYDGEKTILFEDFEGQIDYPTILRICDGHQLKCPIKGGFVSKNWNHVIFTSNKPPENWWLVEDIDAFIVGRITKKIHLD